MNALILLLLVLALSLSVSLAQTKGSTEGLKKVSAEPGCAWHPHVRIQDPPAARDPTNRASFVMAPLAPAARDQTTAASFVIAPLAPPTPPL